ncbi:MAG: SPFH domain-containing protein, partial [Clostridia bacterium]|nr:SPFH domain-containing protein [Clostridia bacterium]
MGIFRKQLLKVVSWEDNSTNTLVHKFEQNDRYAIMKGSQLIVRPSQAAIFVYRGSVCDVFTEGNYKLDEGSIPILTKLANWKYAFENPKETDVYFVNLRRFTHMKWGTPNPVMMRDKDFGMIRISGHGEYSFHVENPALFMRECFGTIRSFRT